MKLLLQIIIAFICVFPTLSQQEKKVQFIGTARSVLSHSNLTTDKEDTVTAPKSTGGYALIDMGIKINPNRQTEILGMFRIRNAFGGFWGGGVTFDVRQLHVRGVAADVVRYQIGTIDYKLTPYTFYNHNADILTNSTGAMGIKEDVFNYESFYKDNTWRQQGASVNFALQFPKVVKDIEFNGFVTRLNPTNFANILERLYGGGNMVINQGKYVSLGINHVSIFDLKGTALDSNLYRNSVSTLTYDVRYSTEKMKIGIDGESGISSNGFTLNEDEKLTDFFVHTRAYYNSTKKALSMDLGYMNNGADFRSYGAQSKRVDYDQQNTFYNRYTNDQILRPVSVYDMYNDPTLISNGIRAGIMNYNPSVNNALPYGIATFNRQGAYFGISYKDPKKIIETDAKYYFLSEIRGQGTTNLKSFSYAKANVDFKLSTLLNWKRNLTIQASLAHQLTTRTGDFTFEDVNLNSFTMNMGVEFELVDKLFLMGNFFVLQSKGVDQMPVRDSGDNIIFYEEYSVDGMESNLSGGLRFDFSKNVYLAAFYERNSNNFVVDNPYNFNQMSIYYVMKF